MNSHFVLLSSRHTLQNNGNNADFVVSSKPLHNAVAVKAITPIMIRFLDSFTTYPDIVYIDISLFANGNFIEVSNSNVHNIMCAIPMTDISTGNSVEWEPQDKKLHTIINHAADFSNESIRVRLYDENFNLLVANPNNHIDMIVELKSDDREYA